MRIRVDNIPAEGQRVPAGLDTAWAREATAEALDSAPTALSATFRIDRAGPRGRIAVQIEADAAAPAVCDRCGEDLSREVQVRSTLDYLPEPSASATPDPDAEVELEEDELDVGWYADGHLSLPDILTEAFALALPSRTLCTDDAACDARTEALLAAGRAGAPGHPAFAALKTLTN